ncbi:MAG: adenylosuccinate lyase [Euryarchaeota archaeon]|nr:adenylosuccinate lyase [Euryarchaeota archaeon]MDE1836315.1 adenylosuccinate lyase [Euryarchaeota archaeon]MDE1879113.1 adenylosuccinate lyase [Euryarchaeota archaeon]MDE2044289.1 adenylosuccinate lyase [Thermoplasmata archaeon]
MKGPEEDLVCPLEFRYGPEKVRALFTRRARLSRWLRVESALAQALADEKLIPPDAAKAIARAATPELVKLERVDELERETRHDVMALSRALAEKSGEGARWVHFGATSNDILDSALGLELQETVAVLDTYLTSLIAALLDQGEAHRGTAMVGRTHGQHAVPFTLGYKLAGFAAEFLRHRTRLGELAPRLAVGKMSGAVGTGASFGEHASAVEDRTMKGLGLSAEPAPTQIVARDRLAELVNWIALVGSSADRLATEVRNLQRSEIGELGEPFDEVSQVGSSTMAQKRNPTNAENISSLARLLRAFAGVPLENMVQWHERDLANSANERIVLPHAVLLLAEMLERLTTIVRGLRVDPSRMRENLESSGGAVMAEALLLAMTERGVPRAESHEAVRQLTRALPHGDARALLARARENQAVARWFSKGELERLLDPEAYVRSSERKAARVLASLRKELARPSP